jgi:hypothetical protein
MEIKAFQAVDVKAISGDDADGTFEAVVAVFGNVDSFGDRVEPGAFKESLAKGFPPCVWSHVWNEPPIGATLEASETAEGLLIKSRLFLDENERAREVYAGLKNVGGDGRPVLREFSFAYDILDAEWVTEDGEEIFSLKRLDLIEVGPCLKGVNDQTRLVGVKGIDRVRPQRPSEGAESLTDDQETAYRKARDLLTMTVQPTHQLGAPGEGSS